MKSNFHPLPLPLKSHSHSHPLHFYVFHHNTSLFYTIINSKPLTLNQFCSFKSLYLASNTFFQATSFLSSVALNTSIPHSIYVLFSHVHFSYTVNYCQLHLLPHIFNITGSIPFYSLSFSLSPRHLIAIPFLPS